MRGMLRPGVTVPMDRTLGAKVTLSHSNAGIALLCAKSVHGRGGKRAEGHPTPEQGPPVGSCQVWRWGGAPGLGNLHPREVSAVAWNLCGTRSPHLATDWMTFEEVSLMLVSRRPVPPRRMSSSPP